MLISTQTASSSAALIWTGLPSTYETLMLDIKDMIPSAGGNSLVLQVSEDNGATWKTTGYNSAGTVTLDNSAAAIVPTAATNAAAMPLSGSQTTSAGTSLSTQVAIRGVASSSLFKMITSVGTGASSGPHYQTHQFGGTYQGDTGVVNAIKIFFGAGNIASGTASLYGLQA